MELPDSQRLPEPVRRRQFRAGDTTASGESSTVDGRATEGVDDAMRDGGHRR
jgi:hypothetical protein